MKARTNKLQSIEKTKLLFNEYNSIRGYQNPKTGGRMVR